MIFWGCLPLKVVFNLRICTVCFGYLSLSLIFEYDPIIDSWDIPFPVEVIFIFRICRIWYGHLSLSFKFEFDPITGCWDLQLLIFWSCLLLEVIFLFRICKIWFGQFKIWVCSNKWLIRYSIFKFQSKRFMLHRL